MGRHIDNGPNASALMETARSFGNYDLGSAFADLIDNSIQAEAKIISVLCLWNGGDPQISIADDGKGMNENELVVAMRLASRSPREKRALGDLGRFGLGLKTASFSQCRRLTVLSRTSGGALEHDGISIRSK